MFDTSSSCYKPLNILFKIVACTCVFALVLLNVNKATAATFQWPVDNVNPMNNGYAAFNKIGNNKYHTGFDLTSSTGSLIVRAAASGTVRIVPLGTYSNNNHNMGNAVIIDHNNGKGPFTLYAHLASITV